MDISRTRDAHIVDNSYLKVIKATLLSRNVTKQITAVQSLIDLLHMATPGGSSRVADSLVDADIAEFLTEAAATQSDHLLKCVLTCLELLLNSSKFFTQGHSLCVVECLLRTMSFLLKQENEESILKKAMIILGKILEVSAYKFRERNKNKGNMQPNEFNMPQIILMLNNVLDQKHRLQEETILTATEVFCSVLLNIHVEWPDKLSDTVELCYSALKDIILSENVSELSSKAILTMSNIAYLIMSLVQSLSDDNYFNMSCGGTVQQCLYKERTLKLIEEYIASICSTYILEREVFVSDLSVCYGVLTSLVVLYSEPAVDKNNITQRLVSNGYISYLPMLIIIANKRNHNSLKKMCGLVLSELLVDLSNSALDIEKYWPGGCSAFKRALSAGILSLPPGTRHWCHILKMQEVSQHIKNCILIYFYFLVLLIRAEDVNMDLSALVEYLLLFPDGLILPFPILKVLLLVFSVATLSSQDNVHPDLFNKANQVLLNAIEKCDRFAVIYSHHPALLYWAFLSYDVPYRFQCDILQLWLEHEDDDAGGILTHLLLTKYEASFCLLDVIQHSKNPVLSRGMLVFNKALLHEQQNNKDTLIGLLWNMLPRVLAKYSTGITPLCDTNVATFMQLACTSSPCHVNSTDVTRAAIFVSNILSSEKSSSLEFDIAAVQLALHLLLASIESRDIRVLIAYIKQRNFLRRLHEACESPDTEICSSSVRLLAKLLFLQEKLHLTNSITCMQYINLEGKKLLKLLSHTNVNILKASVELAIMLMKTKATVPIVKIALDGGYTKSNSFILALFGKIQDVCCKRLAGIQESCWQCMGTILAYAAHRHVDPALLPLLSTQPWTHVLVRVELGCGSSRTSPGFLYFVCCWLLYYQCSKARPTYSRFQSRRMLPDLLSISATRIATALLNQTVQCNNTDRQHKLYLTALLRVLHSQAELPYAVEKQLRKRLEDCSLPADASDSDASN